MIKMLLVSDSVIPVCFMHFWIWQFCFMHFWIMWPLPFCTQTADDAKVAGVGQSTFCRHPEGWGSPSGVICLRFDSFMHMASNFWVSGTPHFSSVFCHHFWGTMLMAVWQFSGRSVTNTQLWSCLTCEQLCCPSAAAFKPSSCPPPRFAYDYIKTAQWNLGANWTLDHRQPDIETCKKALNNRVESSEDLALVVVPYAGKLWAAHASYNEDDAWKIENDWLMYVSWGLYLEPLDLEKFYWIVGRWCQMHLHSCQWLVGGKNFWQLQVDSCQLRMVAVKSFQLRLATVGCYKLNSASWKMLLLGGWQMNMPWHLAHVVENSEVKVKSQAVLRCR